MKSCELCKLVDGNVITEKYFESDDWLIVDCKTCKIPMVVYKEHTVDIPEEKLGAIYETAEYMFPNREPRHKMRKIKDHYHFHLERRS